MSSMILAAAASAAAFAVIQAGTCIVFFKPDRLRFAEVPAWLLTVLAGQEARMRLQRIMTSRERAEREAIRQRVERDIEIGKELGRSGRAPDLLGMAAIRSAGVPMAEVGRDIAEGLAVALQPASRNRRMWRQEWRCHRCGSSGWEERRENIKAVMAVQVAAVQHARHCPSPQVLLSPLTTAHKPPQCPVCKRRGCGAFHAPLPF